MAVRRGAHFELAPRVQLDLVGHALQTALLRELGPTRTEAIGLLEISHNVMMVKCFAVVYAGRMRGALAEGKEGMREGENE